MTNKATETKENVVKEEKNSCFIITPIGSPDSETFKKTRGLISSVIDPVLEEFDFEAVPAYNIANSGSINRQILKCILNDRLVIANLSGLNPNVMYELAVRHAVRLPIIIMAEHGTNLPFDITDQRTIFYHDSLLGSEEAKPRLREAIRIALKDGTVDNPIYQVVEEGTIIKAVQGKDQSFNEYLIRRLDQLENNLISIKQMRVNEYPLPSKLSSTVRQQPDLIEIEFQDKSLSNDDTVKILKEKIGSRFATWTISNSSEGRVTLTNIRASDNSIKEVVSLLNNSKDLKVIHLDF